MCILMQVFILTTLLFFVIWVGEKNKLRGTKLRHKLELAGLTAENDIYIQEYKLLKNKHEQTQIKLKSVTAKVALQSDIEFPITVSKKNVTKSKVVDTPNKKSSSDDDCLSSSISSHYLSDFNSNSDSHSSSRPDYSSSSSNSYSGGGGDAGGGGAGGDF